MAHVALLTEAREKRISARKLLDNGVKPSSYQQFTRGIGTISEGDLYDDREECAR